MSRMQAIIRELKDDFIIVDLGSADAVGFKKQLGEASKAVTFVELDAVSVSSVEDADYHRMVKFNKAISGTTGKRTFYQRRFENCSSFLQPLPQIVSQYGLEDYFVVDKELEFDCSTLDSLLKETGVSRIDFLKTDLEGLDFEILFSSPAIVENTLVIQSEVRFQPFYKGEPYFHEIASFLAEKGFELFTLLPEVWKAKTKHRSVQRDGRLVMADAVFFLTPAKVKEIFKDTAPRAFLKQILLAKALNLHNYAESLYEDVRDTLKEEWRNDLNDLFIPQSNFENSMITLISNTSGNGFLAKVVRFFHKRFALAARITAQHPDHPHIGAL